MKPLASSMDVEVLRGNAIAAHLRDLARLRIGVFAEWPYLYAGSPDYEERYLKDFAKASSAVLVVVCDAGRIVGASTALALAEESAELRQPFEAAHLPVDEWFYLAESVLEPSYRRRGLGHRFFEAREQAGRAQGFERFAFCAVERSPRDVRRPTSHFELAPFWARRGYAPTALVAHLTWQEHGEKEETPKPLRFWVKGAPEVSAR